MTSLRASLISMKMIPLKKTSAYWLIHCFTIVDWEWAMNNDANMSMGWHPESGFIQNRWKGYSKL
ncbi:MAG: hypothetical protein H6540_04880 [Bacteroidales bacterium]|nr:hypothetical protein [Bacteroidales bacterium]